MYMYMCVYGVVWVWLYVCLYVCVHGDMYVCMCVDVCMQYKAAAVLLGVLLYSQLVYVQPSEGVGVDDVYWVVTQRHAFWLSINIDKRISVYHGYLVVCQISEV